MPRGDETDVFDLDAFEKEGDPFAWSFGGTTFTFPADPPVEAIEYLSKGDLQMSLWLLLGKDEYERLDALEARLTTGKFGALVDAYFKHVGVDLGKSSKPSKSARLTRSAKALR
jgi:hypothetical protein